MKPQTEEQWLMVLAVIERLYAEVRAGNWDGLSQMLHGYTTSPPEPSEQHQQALDRACYVIMELMQAYERRIRSDCITQAQIDNKPWECAEYIKGERFLKAIWKDGRAQPFAALDEFLGYLRTSPGEPSENQALRQQVRIERAKFDSALQHLCAITAMLHPNDIRLPDGRVMEFAPPADKVQDYWRGLTDALKAAREHVDSVSPEPRANPLPFTHWSKDPLIPYQGCNCSSCAEVRVLSLQTTISASSSTKDEKHG